MCAIIGFDSPTLTEQEIRPYFDRTISRGPDMSRMEKAGRGMLGFHRLAIMGLHEEGMQPFHLGGDMAVCNGELYGFRPLKKELEAKGYTFASESDCELILPLYREYGVEMFAKLDAEFAMIIYDAKADRLVAARDPIGIRPLFYGYLADGGILFASEAKNLVGLVEKVRPFPPGCWWRAGEFHRYADPGAVSETVTGTEEELCAGIRTRLVAAVKKRLVSDAKVGFLLSGGLDSSLVCGIAARLCPGPIRTFAIGMSGDAIDLGYAREVADFLGSEHMEVVVPLGEALAALEEVIAAIAVGAVREVEGVSGMMGNLGTSVADLVTNKKGAQKNAKGVKIEMTETGLVLDIYLTVAYGHAIPEVAENAQKAVASAVSDMTGCTVETVNIHVGGVTLA